VWAGVEVFRAGGRVIGIEYDAETLDALRARCAQWLPADGIPDDLAVPAAFGVRTAKVGFRRRRVGVVHHGAPVRYRLDSPDEAVDVIARILADLATERPSNVVVVDARCFVRGGRAALIDIPPSRDVDERSLRAAAIEEVPTWRPRIDPDAMTVHVGDLEWALSGIASIGRPMVDLDARRRHLWQLADGDVLAWAELLDDLDDDRMVFVEDLLDACERLLP